MKLTSLELKQFTAFSEIQLEFSPGINVFIGANGTGKTHILKVAYAACEITKSGKSFPEKLIRVFMPSGGRIGRLVKRQKGSSRAYVALKRGDMALQAEFTNHTSEPINAKVSGLERWLTVPTQAVFIPVKEMLSHAPGFRSLYAQREIHFDETYSDILDRAYLPVLRGKTDQSRRKLLAKIEKTMAGTVYYENEEFFLKSKQGEIEFSLLAEGMRKLALLWLLIQNGTLLEGSVLFWDEPEANLNPSLYGPLIDMLIQLQREGVQVFLATHDYVILKELDLRVTSEDKVLFYGLYEDRQKGNICYYTSDKFAKVEPNVILDTFDSLYERELERSLKTTGKHRDD